MLNRSLVRRGCASYQRCFCWSLDHTLEVKREYAPMIVFSVRIGKPNKKKYCLKTQQVLNGLYRADPSKSQHKTLDVADMIRRRDHSEEYLDRSLTARDDKCF